MNFTAAGQSNSKEVDESIFQYICCLLLRHITQLVCNGHAIYDVGACDTGVYIFFRCFPVFIWSNKKGFYQIKQPLTSEIMCVYFFI